MALATEHSRSTPHWISDEVEDELRLFDDYLQLPRMDFLKPGEVTNAIMARLNRRGLVTNENSDVIIAYLLQMEKMVGVASKYLEIRMQDLRALDQGVGPKNADFKETLVETEMAYARWFRASKKEPEDYLNDPVGNELLCLRKKFEKIPHRNRVY